MMAVHEKKPLPLVAYVLDHRILAVVAALLNQDIFWCRNNYYHPFDGYLLQQAGDSYPPFDEYSSYPVYGNIFWYSLIKLYDSRQRNIVFYRPFDGDIFVVSYDEIWFIIRLADPSFLLCDLWDSWIPQQSQCVYEHQSAAQTAVLTLLCLITTGYLGRIFFFFLLMDFVTICGPFSSGWSQFSVL